MLNNISTVSKNLIGLVVLMLICTQNLIIAQTLGQQQVPFFANNASLGLALTGGLNNPQFSEVDLNNDGIQDLFVFDKQGHIKLTFINQGTPHEIDYHFAPEYVKHFPLQRSWMMLRDYNCDGIQDVFSSSRDFLQGITVHKGYYNGDTIAYTEIVERIDYQLDTAFADIFVLREDYPAIDDIDGDGDLDILTFDPGGGWVQYFENQSQDLGFACDSLIFSLVDDCWGRFYEEGMVNELDLSPSVDSCVRRADFIKKSTNEIVHTGSTLLTLDMDNDGDKEVLLGDVIFNTTIMGINGGNEDTAWIAEQIIDFPDNTTSIDIPIFPTNFYLDVDNDGIKDLLAAPNARNISENYHCAWWYQNIGNNDFPEFEYKKSTFLIDQMVDLGAGTAPSFFDHNSDGLMDIVVGNFGFFNSVGDFDASVFLYENTGTIEQPEFTLRDNNFAKFPENENLSSIDLTFGDLDDDGDEDMIFGVESGMLYFSENVDSGDGMAVFENYDTLYGAGEVPIKIGKFASPYLVDIDRDGLFDLVIGEQKGNLNYLQNTGTSTQAVFVETDDFWGKIDTREPNYFEGYSAPVVKEVNGAYVLFTASEPGNIRRYEGIEMSMAMSEAFIKTDSLFGGIVQGDRTRMDVADIDNDGLPEYLVGNRRGGLALYSNSDLTTSSTIPGTPDFSFAVFPNPTHRHLNIHYRHPQDKIAKFHLFDVLGRTLYHGNIDGNRQLNIAELSSGIYLLQIQVENVFLIEKIVKK